MYGSSAWRSSAGVAGPDELSVLGARYAEQNLAAPALAWDEKVRAEDVFTNDFQPTGASAALDVTGR